MFFYLNLLKLIRYLYQKIKQTLFSKERINSNLSEFRLVPIKDIHSSNGGYRVHKFICRHTMSKVYPKILTYFHCQSMFLPPPKAA